MGWASFGPQSLKKIVVPSFVAIVAIESSPVVLFSDSESVIDLESAALGNPVAAKAATPPISRSRRVNSAIYLVPRCLTTVWVLCVPFTREHRGCTKRAKLERPLSRATLAKVEDAKPQIALSEA